MSITIYCIKSLNFLSKLNFVDAKNIKQVKVENMHIVVKKAPITRKVIKIDMKFSMLGLRNEWNDTKDDIICCRKWGKWEGKEQKSFIDFIILTIGDETRQKASTIHSHTHTHTWHYTKPEKGWKTIHTCDVKVKLLLTLNADEVTDK